MKKRTKGFVVQGVLALVALVLIGFGAYAVSIKDRRFDCCHGEQYQNQTPPVSEWKRYTNDRLGFEFKYPNTFEVITDSSGMNPGTIIIMHPEDKNKTGEPLDAIYINEIENKEKLSVTDWWNKYGPYTEKNNEIGLTPNTLPMKKMVVGGNEGIYIGGSEGVLSNYLILSRGDKILEINLMANDSMKILSTFKFTSPSTKFDSNSQPSITLLSPNGGESFVRDIEIPISWSQNYNSSSVKICILSKNAGCVFTSGAISTNSGTNYFTIPSNACKFICNTGNCYLDSGYKIQVTTDSPPGTPGEFLSDSSDNYFAVTNVIAN